MLGKASMPLEIVEIKDLRTFVRAFLEANRDRMFDDQDLTEGYDFGNGDGRNANQREGGAFLQGPNLYMYRQALNKNNLAADSGQNPAARNAIYATDALLRDPGDGWWQPTIEFRTTLGGLQIERHFGGLTSFEIAFLIPGQMDPSSRAQAFYLYGITDGIQPDADIRNYVRGWHSFQASDAEPIERFEDLWPNISANMVITNGGALSGQEGYWRVAFQTGIYAIAFEGITDTTGGMPGETDSNAGMIRGGTSHPKGLLLTRPSAVNFLGDGIPNNLDTRWTWVDLDTGLAVGVLGLPAIVDSESDSDFSENRIGPSNFIWSSIQFVADEGSSFARPKGEIHLGMVVDDQNEINNHPIVDPGGNDFTATVSRQFVVVHDFNPFNETSGRVRVHNRRTFLGEIDTPFGPIISGGSTAPGFGTTHNNRSPKIYYDPQSQTYVGQQHVWQTPGGDIADLDQPIVGASRLIRWRRQTAISDISQPTPFDAVTESSTILAQMVVSDDFGIPVAGTTIHFQTERQSTRDEGFSGTTQGSSDYVVARGVIDNDGSLEVRSGGGIDIGGALLTIGVDYTVSDFATGTLSPVGSWPSAVISVRYRHRSAPVTPGFGTLLGATAVTNEIGIVNAAIELGPNLEGEIIGLNVDTEDVF